MGSRRQEKMARVIKEAVSEAILNNLSDPRIHGMITVTRVELTPDMKTADIYLSIYAGDKAKEMTTFKVIENANNHIRVLSSKYVTAKFMPRFCFHMDEQYKKTLEILNLIDKAAEEYKDKPVDGEIEIPEDND
jgi:ribosome-binding factor A